MHIIFIDYIVFHVTENPFSKYTHNQNITRGFGSNLRQILIPFPLAFMMDRGDIVNVYGVLYIEYICSKTPFMVEGIIGVFSHGTTYLNEK